MSGTAVYRARLTTATAAAPRHRVAMRAIVLVATVGGIASVGLAGGHANGLIALVVVVLAVFAGARPDSDVGALVIAIVIPHWYVAVGANALAWAVVPALCVLVAHSALAALAVTPSPCFLPRASGIRWAAHAGLVMVATGAVWAVTWYLSSLNGNGQQPVTVLGFLVLAATALVLGQRALVRDP